LTELIGIGAELKQAREARGLAIDDVAQQLKFAPRQIESLEHERFDRLPVPTIARGMVRNYARLLKLDPAPLIERMMLRAQKAPDAGPVSARFRPSVPDADGAKRSTLIYAGFSIGLLVLVGVVGYEWWDEKATLEFVAPAPPQRPQPPPAPEQVAAATPAAPVTVIEPPPAAENKPEAEPATKPAVVVEKPAPAGAHRIFLRSEQEAWIEVKDGTGRLLMSSLAPAGSERTLRGRPPFEIVIGNASFVTLLHNDKPIDLKPHTKVQTARLKLK